MAINLTKALMHVSSRGSYLRIAYVRALREERPLATFQADERTQRRLRRATQLPLAQDNCFRTLRGEVERQIDALFVPSLLT